jgi:hypothetical protein
VAHLHPAAATSKAERSRRGILLCGATGYAFIPGPLAQTGFKLEISSQQACSLFLVGMILRVMLGGLLSVMRSLMVMALRDVRVVTGELVFTGVVMLGGLVMMLGGLLVMLRGLPVMCGALMFAHRYFPPGCANIPDGT